MLGGGAEVGETSKQRYERAVLECEAAQWALKAQHRRLQESGASGQDALPAETVRLQHDAAAKRLDRAEAELLDAYELWRDEDPHGVP